MDLQGIQNSAQLVATSREPVPKYSNANLMEVARSMEAAFLAEMLKSMGFGEQPEGFGGGAGEDQFASFMREEQAKQMTKAGGIGLAQSLFEAMTERTNA